MYLITKEQYYNNLKQRFPAEDFTVLDPFVSATGPVDIQCNKCKQIFHYRSGTTLYNKKKKHFCSFCNTKSIASMFQTCEKENISIIEIKFNVIEPWLLHCNFCRLDFQRAPSTWLQKSCPRCGRHNNMYSIEQRQKMVDNVFGIGEFQVLSTGCATQQFIVKHKCGFIRKTQFSNFIRSAGCPKCAKTMSKGERRIVNFLMAHDIQYVSQMRMGETKQSFDFFIPHLNMAIEYNGEQHYKPIETFGGEARFIQQQQYDKNKVEYCKEHNITLKIISYKEYDLIEDILNNLFKKFNDQSNDVGEN